jgi:hypothetical protein
MVFGCPTSPEVGGFQELQGLAYRVLCKEVDANHTLYLLDRMS